MSTKKESIEWTLLRRTTLRHWRFTPRQSLLLVGIFALGIAVFVSVRLANRAAVSSFGNFADSLTGQSDWIIQPAAGSLPETVLTELRQALGVRPVLIVPIVEASAASTPAEGAVKEKGRPDFFNLLGVDLVSLANLQGGLGTNRPLFRSNQDEANAPSRGFWEVLRGGAQIWVSRSVASWAGPKLDLVVNEKIVALPIAGALPSDRALPQVSENLVVLDLPQLQALTGKVGRVDRIEFLVEPGARSNERRAELGLLLEGLSKDRWSVQTSGARRETGETMTRAFRLNLTVLSLIALMVGLYLVFQTLDGAVVRRRTEIAILRSLGVESRTIRRLGLLEAAVLGAIGGVLGLLLGWAGAQVSVRAVGRTINALYYSTTVNSAGLSWTEAGITLFLSVAVSIVAGWWPARDAALIPPAQVLSRQPATSRPSRRWTRLAGLIGVALGVVMAQLPPLHFRGGGRFPLAGYFAAFLWIFGGGLLAPVALTWVSRFGNRASGASGPARLAFSYLKTPSSRHRLAVAALLCAVGMAAGMIILVGSFEHSVRAWIDQSLQADLYISSKGAQTAFSRNRITEESWNKIAAHSAVAQASAQLSYPIEFEKISTLLSGVDLSVVRTRGILSWVSPPRDNRVFDPKSNGTLALVSESFCERFGKKVGDVLQIPTPMGRRSLTIVGEFSDYGNERGLIFVDRSHLSAWFQENGVTSLSLTLKPGTSLEATRAELLAEFPGLTIYSQSALRREILRIFRQTFSITYALELIGLAVAVAGLAMTLASVLFDRREELTTLRALGFSRRELAWTTALEGLGLSTVGVVSGLILSVALGWLLIFVINKQSFGWTLSLVLPATPLFGLGALVVLTGGAVAYAVGLWGAALPADREE